MPKGIGSPDLSKWIIYVGSAAEIAFTRVLKAENGEIICWHDVSKGLWLLSLT